MRKIKKIVVHCSASPDGMDIGADEIRKLHASSKDTDIDWFGTPLKGRGWSDIGYHWVIRRNGKCEQGRPESKMGAHVKGHNRDSIGIVWIGTKYITEAQKKTLDRVIRGALKAYDLSVEDVYGHYELFSGKTCPNLDMAELRKSLRTEEYLPSGPSDDEIEINLIDIENQVLDDD